MSQSLAKDFNFRSLLKFAFPSIIMMIFMSLQYCGWLFHRTVRGQHGAFRRQYRLSCRQHSSCRRHHVRYRRQRRCRRKDRTGKLEADNRNFSALTLTTLIIGILGAVLGNLFCRQICSLLGATPVLMDYGTAYLRTILSFAPVCLLQALFQSFFVTAGRPGLGLSLTVSAGITNMILDYLFVVPLHLGVAGVPLPPTFTSVSRPLPVFYTLPLPEKGLRFTRYTEFSKAPALHKLLQRFLRDGQQSFRSRCHLPFQHADAEIRGRNRCCRHHGDSVRTVSLCCAVPRLQYRRCTCVQLQLRQPEQTAADPALPHQYPLRRGKLCDHCTCGCLRFSCYFRRFHAERHVRL